MPMAQKPCLTILLATLVAFCCASAGPASQGDCLPYEPASVTLTGKVSTKVFPGPPNYESVKEGDKPEVAWLLHLAKPVCVRAENQDDLNSPEDGVSDIQLVLQGNQFRQVRRMMKKGAVTVTGKLFHSHTGHHHATVLIVVNRIKQQ
jgi:hypothetical protein